MFNRAPAPVSLAIVLFALFGILIALYATHWGVGASPDSVTYIGAARSLAQGQGFTSAFGADPPGGPITWYPPLYPAALASTGLLRFDPYDAARWLQSALVGLSVLLFGLWAARTYKSNPWIAIVGALLLLVSASLLPVYSMAWSEGLFIVLAFSGLWSLSVYLAGISGAGLMVAGVLLGLAWLTRYSGVAYVATGALGVLLFSIAPPARRVRDALVFGVLATLPMAVWMVRNRLVGESSTGRRIEFHPFGAEHVRQALETVSGWLQVPDAAPGAVKLVAVVGVVLVMALAAYLLWKDRTGPRSPGQGTLRPEEWNFVALQLLSVLVYSALLVFSISFVDANTPLDDRILVPVYVTLLLVSTYVIYRVWSSNSGGKAIRGVVIVALAALIALNVQASVQFARTAHAHGLGWSDVRWHESDLMEAVRALPPETALYSNAPDGVYLHTGRPVVGLPRRTGAAFAGGENAYMAELQRIADRLRGGAVIVQIESLAGRSSSTVTEDVQRLLPLRVAVETADGQILVSETR